MRILSLAPLAGPGVDALRALGDLEIDPWNAHVPIRLHSSQELIARLQGVDALIVEADFIPAEVLSASALRFLGVCRGDPNNVDVAAATAARVAVIRTPGRNAGAVADLTLGLIFALLRSIVAADRDVRAGRWVVDGRIAQQRYVGRELSSCVVGLVGAGAVGREVARRLIALGARVCAFDPAISTDELSSAGIEPFASVGDLIERSDIVSIHAPLTPGTRGLVGADDLARAREPILLVNTARYGIVDEGAMLDGLRAGTIAAAALDHFEHEFLPDGHPLVSMPNVVLTPHIGGTTIETVENHTAVIARAIDEMLGGGIPPEVVNPDVLPLRTP